MNAWVCKTIYYSGICILNALRNLLWFRSKYNRSSFQNTSQLNKKNMKITGVHLGHLVEFYTHTGAVSTWMAGQAHWCCLYSHQCFECLSGLPCLYIASMPCSTCACLLGVHHLPHYWLDLGTWSSCSLTSLHRSSLT